MVGVLAVKDLALAKTRLAEQLSTGIRARLVLAMMRDTVAVLHRSGAAGVVVVSPDPRVLAAAEESGARVLAESATPGASTRGHAQLNRAFVAGSTVAAHAWEDPRVMLVQADLPAARADHLATAADLAIGTARAIITDRDGSGTTLLVVDRAGELTDRPPRFGSGSARRHVAQGATDLSTLRGHPPWPDLRTDVDTLEDLAVAAHLGTGDHTRAVIAELHASGALSQTG
ncbi:2-phospho-L-lactate guanylyltransferase [Williamsia sterculiae]|uniref:Phosphoenolpyruvate guanylyltransferase n=1 Tax=Williamsia sterculiae TaxID=1344003 RepID=A0A1N7G4R1_9NOCA|nr:2-phospho-L-lactate guanylyltransferase [Williamsia sterculiae]